MYLPRGKTIRPVAGAECCGCSTLGSHLTEENNRMTILVTGGTGLVGSRLLRHFLELGVACRGLVRGGVTRAEGDLLDPASLTGAVRGVSAVVHLAAVLRTPEPETIWATNVEG